MRAPDWTPNAWGHKTCVPGRGWTSSTSRVSAHHAGWHGNGTHHDRGLPPSTEFFVATHSGSPKFGGILDFGPNLRRCWANSTSFFQVGWGSTKFGPISTDVKPPNQIAGNRPTLTRINPESTMARTRPNVARFRPALERSTEFGQSWPGVDQFGPNPATCDPTPTKSGPISTKFGATGAVERKQSWNTT